MDALAAIRCALNHQPSGDPVHLGNPEEPEVPDERFVFDRAALMAWCDQNLNDARAAP